MFAMVIFIDYICSQCPPSSINKHKLISTQPGATFAFTSSGGTLNFLCLCQCASATNVNNVFVNAIQFPILNILIIMQRNRLYALIPMCFIIIS